MTRVLLIGQIPETVDFSDPALPPGFNAEKIHAGIALVMGRFAARGWAADNCLVPPDASAAASSESGGLVLKAMAAFGANRCTALITVSNR